MPSVFNLRNIPNGMEVVRVDRGSRWGNPFILGVDGDRDEVIRKFEEYLKWRLTIQPDWLKPLKGENLACWCAPRKCHADILMKYANK